MFTPSLHILHISQSNVEHDEHINKCYIWLIYVTDVSHLFVVSNNNKRIQTAYDFYTVYM